MPYDAKNRYYSVIDYHDRYVSGELTPTAVVEMLLPLILRNVGDPSPHSVSFISTNVELVRTAAKASTKRYKDGKSLGILDGVPTAIKDESDVAGYRTTLGTSKALPIADTSSWLVQKMEEAGAITMGKLNMHELGADTTNNNPTVCDILDPPLNLLLPFSGALLGYFVALCLLIQQEAYANHCSGAHHETRITRLTIPAAVVVAVRTLFLLASCRLLSGLMEAAVFAYRHHSAVFTDSSLLMGTWVIEDPRSQ